MDYRQSNFLRNLVRQTAQDFSKGKCKSSHVHTLTHTSRPIDVSPLFPYLASGNRLIKQETYKICVHNQADEAVRDAFVADQWVDDSGGYYLFSQIMPQVATMFIERVVKDPRAVPSKPVVADIVLKGLSMCQQHWSSSDSWVKHTFRELAILSGQPELLTAELLMEDDPKARAKLAWSLAEGRKWQEGPQ